MLQTLRFVLNLSLIMFRRGIARLIPPYIKVSLNNGSTDEDCQSYAAEVIDNSYNNTIKNNEIIIFSDKKIIRG